MEGKALLVWFRCTVVDDGLKMGFLAATQQDNSRLRSLVEPDMLESNTGFIHFNRQVASQIW